MSEEVKTTTEEVEKEIKEVTVDEIKDAIDRQKKLKKEFNYGQYIKIQYLPYVQKMALAKSIIDTTSYIQVGDKKIYRRDTPTMLFIFTTKLLETYTLLKLDPENIPKIYDELMESGLMNKLMEQIPDSEIKILQGMMDMYRDDLEYNTRSLVSFFEAKTEAFSMAFDSLISVLDNPEIQKKLSEIKSSK